jgi:serine/threonine protein kinase/tetratricopeptide (TPR) repeat protein
MDGSTIGPYRIIEAIGAGGMGEVYRAHDARLQRDVALKLLPRAHAADDEARARLLREARAAAALNHPHICTIYDVGESDGRAYIAMELVDGRPLDHAIPDGGLAPAEVIAVGLQIADAVAHAHDMGVLHRDLKSSNIMVTPVGRVKVLDFGLAKRVTREGPPDATTAGGTLVTRPGHLAGTLAYMAPEQLRGQPASAASDVWAVGVVLHEMAAGRRPFDGRTGFEVASAILDQPPHSLPATVPTGLQAIVGRCLAKAPLQRYQTAGELVAALEAIRAGPALPAGPRAPVTPPTHRPWPRVAGWSVAALVALVLALAGARGALHWSTRATPPPRIASIAVLPLENLSGDPDEEYFATGMQDGLITELARLRALDRVIERRSTRRFAATTHTASEIAAALGVDVVMTGTVHRSGDRVQLTAQVVDAATERHLWADRFEHDLREAPSLQANIVQAVAAAIGLELTAEEQRRWATVRPVDPETYEAYLRGMHLIARGPGGRAERQRGLAILQEAIDRDPGNAHAYAGLALGYVTFGHGPLADADAWPLARAAALRAIALDPTLAEAHSALAEVRTYYEWDWPGAEQSFLRAAELNPHLAMNHYHYSWYLALFGRWEEAIAAHKRAQELDPLTPQHMAYLGALYLYQDRFEEAIAAARRAIAVAPEAPAAWGVLAVGLAQMGQFEEAEAAIDKGASIAPAMLGFERAMFHAARGRTDEAIAEIARLEAQPPTPWSVWSLSQAHIAMGNYDEAFRWLAHRPAHAFLPWVRVHPPFRAIHADPRFVALMEEMRLPMP